MKVLFICVLLQIVAINCFIIPDELPSILSVIYSNIPTLKKGTDSRFGWGFKLGDRADFQILTELGPQIYTQKLANQEEEGGVNKRNTLNNLANKLYAQRQQEKREEIKKKEVPKSDSEKWLQKWSKTVVREKEVLDQTQIAPKNAKPGLGVGEIDAKSVIPEDAEDSAKSKTN
ncbi:uncharacterized protein snsl [Euwallacea fornicatus]|uniref:uncharacterized protein snsl n=1 Tax=Euwallacea fornicatus TaxID=995702 RepID=UPI00338F72CA